MPPRRVSGALEARLDSLRKIVRRAPVSYSVYSAFSFYGSRRGGELPGTWLVSGLGALGHEVAAIRQTLYRMEASDELTSSMSGRTKTYRLSGYANATVKAGLSKIMDPAPIAWDGEWSLVQVRKASDRIGRDQLQGILRTEGFARCGPGLFVHPRDRSARIVAAATEHGTIDLLQVFRGRRAGPEDDRTFVARHWDLDGLAKRYRAFLVRFGPWGERAATLSPADAFLARFAVVFEHLETAWSDPELPLELLPRGWPGSDARDLARSLYQRLLPGAIARGDALMRKIRSA